MTSATVVALPASAGGGANASCRRCAQWPFRTILVAGADEPELCTCNADWAAGGYSGLLERPTEEGRRCGCPDGMFMNHVDRRCVRCSLYEDCDWGASRFVQSGQPPAVLPGFWSEAPPPEDADGRRPFAGHVIWRCTSGSTCRGGHECDGNRYGRACSLCRPGFFGAQDGPCRSCPGTPRESRARMLLGLMVAVILPIFVNVLLKARGELRGLMLSARALRTSLRQMLKFCQVMAITAGFNVAWPAAAQRFFDVMKAVSVNIASWLGAACLTGESSMALEVVARWCFPLAAVVVTCWAAVLVRLLASLLAACGRHSPLPPMSLWDALRVLAFGLSLFFPALLSSSLVVFTCLPPLDGHWPATGWTVKEFPHVQCGTDEEHWQSLAGASGAFALSLIVAFPATVNYAWLQESEARVQSGFEDGGWWSFIFDDYRLVHMDWAVTMLIKDVAINVVACLGAGYGTIQLLLTALISLVYSYKAARRQPYLDKSNNLLETWNGLSVSVLCLFTAGMGFQSEPGVGDVSELFDRGVEDVKYLQRAWTVVVIQAACLAAPTAILTYQLLMAFERTRACVPKRLRPMSADDRTVWTEQFLVAVGMPEVDNAPLRRILTDMDDTEYVALRQVMTSSVATLGLVQSGGGRGARQRFSALARSNTDLIGRIATEGVPGRKRKPARRQETQGSAESLEAVGGAEARDDRDGRGGRGEDREEHRRDPEAEVHAELLGELRRELEALGPELGSRRGDLQRLLEEVRALRRPVTSQGIGWLAGEVRLDACDGLLPPRGRDGQDASLSSPAACALGKRTRDGAAGDV